MRFSQTIPPKPMLTVDQIINVVCFFFDQRPHVLRGHRRNRVHVIPRHVAMFLARKLTRLTLVDIGSHFEDRDHSSVLHACRSIDTLIATDAVLCAEVGRVERHIFDTIGIEPSDDQLIEELQGCA